MPKESNKWLPGGAPKSPGRPKGARNKLGEAFLESLYKDFQAHGISTIVLARESDPVAYLKVVAGLLPRQLTGEDGNPIEATLIVKVVKFAGNPTPE